MDGYKLAEFRPVPESNPLRRSSLTVVTVLSVPVDSCDGLSSATICPRSVMETFSPPLARATYLLNLFLNSLNPTVGMPVM
jgi:hypothetical protein